MSIETAGKIKAELTDKYVVVKQGVPELRRFAALTGVVKTVNMSGRALVQFDGPADISWYDIDPQYLTVVDAPAKKAVEQKHAAPAPTKTRDEKPAVAAKPAGKSPLEMARSQGAAGPGGAPTAAKAATASVPGGGPPAKKLSPLELARQQGAQKGAGSPAPSAAVPTATAQGESAPASQQPQKKMSPLEMARMQGAAKDSGPGMPAAAAPAAPPVAHAAQPVPESKPPAKEVAAAPAGKSLSPLELARQQGAFKGS